MYIFLFCLIAKLHDCILIIFSFNVNYTHCLFELLNINGINLLFTICITVLMSLIKIHYHWTLLFASHVLSKYHLYFIQTFLTYWNEWLWFLNSRKLAPMFFKQNWNLMQLGPSIKQLNMWIYFSYTSKLSQVHLLDPS